MSIKSKLLRYLILAVALCCAFIVLATGFSYAADRDVEWGGYQNSDENNGVTDIAGPASYNEASLKWGEKAGISIGSSFTPPIIVDGYIYTASSYNVFKINKETGQIEAASEKMEFSVNYALFPMTYAKEEDAFFIPLLNGRVECIDTATLKHKWISDSYGNQTISQITYKDGRVYTGTYSGETEDGAYVCLDAENGELLWKLVPSEQGDTPKGFYWTGSYVDDHYAVFGSDDGQENFFDEPGSASYTCTSVVYSCDRETGEVIDKITGCKGDIRSSIVHHNGYIYFTTKGGLLYKAKFNQDGTFSEISSFDTGSMMTASPVIHNGRIYVGVCGNGGQFNADGGHMFCVFSDDEKLSGEAKYEERYVGLEKIKIMVGGTGSFIYNVNIAGYPQAAPLLSTNTGKVDGSVRLYFTYNASPGGIYYLDDSPSSTSTSHNEAKQLFIPEDEMSQYSISPLCIDRDGTLYTKNDSGYMMAVSICRAWLNDVTVYEGADKVKWEKPFMAARQSYTLVASSECRSVDFVLDVPTGMTATIDGVTYSSGRHTVLIAEDASAIPVMVRADIDGHTYTRVYTFNLKNVSNDANLAGLAINAGSNKAPQIIDSADYHANTPKESTGIGYDPVFDPGITDYVSRTYDGDREFVNIWACKNDPDATIKAYPVDNVGNDNYYTDQDGTIPDSSGNTQYSRFPVYWIKGQISATVRIEVTSASGKVTKSYVIQLVRSKNHIDIGKELLYVTPSNATLYTAGGAKTIQAKAYLGEKDVTDSCIWSSSRPSKVTVDAHGVISAQGDEVAQDNPVTVWASYKAQDTEDKPVSVVVIKPDCSAPVSNIVSARYSGEQSISLSTTTPGAKIYYNIGDPSEAAVDTPSDESTEYTGPIKLGEAGKSKRYKIRAIAVADGYKDSICVDFDYIIDMVTPVSVAEITGLDAPAAGELPDYEVSSKTEEVSVSSVEWYRLEDDREVLIDEHDTIQEGADHRVKITLAANSSVCFFDGDTLVSIDGAYRKTILNSMEEMVAICDFRSGTTIDEITVVGLRNPAGGISFYDTAYSTDNRINIDNIVWKTADGEDAPEQPNYYTDYIAEIRVSAGDVNTIADQVSAYVNINGVPTEAELTDQSENMCVFNAVIRSSKFVLDTLKGNGLTVEPGVLDNIPNGTSVDDIIAKLKECHVTATSENGGTIELDGDIVYWDERYIEARYDAADLSPAAFGALGTVNLPEYIDANGSSCEVTVTVNVNDGTVDAPVFTPKAGTYKTKQTVVMSSSTPGASIFYTRSDEKGTNTYESPISMTGKLGKKVSVAFSAYAMSQGKKSKTVTYTITIDRIQEGITAAKKYKVSGLSIKAKSRKFTLTWKKTAGATGYQAQYKLKTAKKWSKLYENTKLKAVTKKLKKGKKYQFRVRTYTKIESKKYYGKWTTVKTIKCK